MIRTYQETSHIVISFPASPHPFPCSGSPAPDAHWVSLNKRHKSLVGLTMVNAQARSRRPFLRQGAPVHGIAAEVFQTACFQQFGAGHQIPGKPSAVRAGITLVSSFRSTGKAFKVLS